MDFKLNLDFLPLINRSMGFSQLREQNRLSYSSLDNVFLKPFITIAREPGSGGEPIAKALAKKLGYEYVNEQLIEEVAKSVSRRKEAIASLDEKSRSAIDDLVQAVLNPEYIDETRFIKELFRTILAYAYRGEVVILGRGANFVTPFARGLHVMVIAPYAVRVQRAIDFEGHTREKAKQVIAEVEEQRQEFVKKYISRDVRKPYAYDLTLNTQYYQVNESVKVISEALQQKFSRSLS